MDNETIVSVTTPEAQELEQPNELLNQENPLEAEMETEQLDEVATVADEILVEVKECRTRLDQQQAALENLQSEGGPAKASELASLKTDLQNTREELRNLLQEWKNSQSPQRSSQSTPETLVEVTEIDPAEAVNPAEKTAPKRKRYRI